MRCLAVVVLCALGACEDAPAPPPPSVAVVAAAPARGAFTGSDSNIFPADYIGPAACGECHAANLARWQTSLHRVMNALPTEPGAVIGNFGGATLAYRDGTATFTHDAAGYAMTLRRGDSTRRYVVTRTIGRRALQEYVGREDGTGEEVRLPFGWWPRAGGWFPQPAFDPWLGDGAAFDPYAPITEAWATRCPWCHSTYPFAQRIARDVGHGLDQYFEPPAAAASGARARVDSTAPPSGGASRVRSLPLDPTAPPSGGASRARSLPLDPTAPPSGGASRARSLPLDPTAPPSGGASRARSRPLDVAAQVTTGISCESCHLGGRAHAAGAPIHFVPRGAQPRPGAPVASTFAAERADAAIVNTVCAQCHSGPSPRLPDGTALRNSSEALDLAAGPCTGLRCTDCHEPHAAAARAPDTEARALAACARCHALLAEPQAARGHAGPHAPADATCLDCHMPRIVLGVDRFVRTHRISSPTDARVYAAGAPNACNVCHLDRSLAWTRAALAEAWGVALRVRADDTPAGELYLASREAAYRVIAAAAYARRPELDAPPALARLADDPLPYVRAWARLLRAPAR